MEAEKMDEAKIKSAVAHFEALVREQYERSDRIKADKDFIDYDKLDKIIIGVCGGDGIGPIITKESARVLEYMLADDVKAGRVEFRVIDGLTMENRVAANKAIPDDVLEELKKCHVILKGPTTTPQAGDPWPNIESANVAMRKALDLFANMRPVKVPDQGIDWTFFRENTEGAYAVGSKGVHVTDDLAMDFVVATTEGCERISRLAYDYAKRNGKNRVSVVSKANVIKTTDGKFLNIAKKIGEEYPEIPTDECISTSLRQSSLMKSAAATSACSSCRTSTAISSRMRLPNSRVVLARQAAQISASATPCLRRFMAPPPA